jgi:hypothetical protein
VHLCAHDAHTAAHPKPVLGSLRQAFITGALPPLDRNIDDVYRETYRTVLPQSCHSDRAARAFRHLPKDPLQTTTNEAS